MKKVIFVCLLTLSVCFSQPAEQSSQLGTTAPNPKSTNNSVTTKPTEAAAPTAPAASTPGQSPGQSPEPSPASPTASSTATSTALPTASPTASSPVTPAKDSKITTPAPSAETSTKNATNETVTTVTPPTSSKPDDHKPTSEAPVPKPEASTPKTIVQARGFDGASFVGGIILTLGLIAIGFMGLKYYRAQTERNYHTL